MNQINASFYGPDGHVLSSLSLVLHLFGNPTHHKSSDMKLPPANRAYKPQEVIEEIKEIEESVLNKESFYKQEFNNLNLLFHNVRKILKILIKCDSITIGMCDGDLIEAFKMEDCGITQVVAVKPHKAFSSHNISKIIEIAHEYSKHFPDSENDHPFNTSEGDQAGNFDAIMKGYRKNGKMIQCAFNPMASTKKTTRLEDVFLVIEWERRTNDKLPNSGNYTLKDEISLKVFCSCLSQRLWAILANFKALKSLKRSLSILEGFKDLTHEKNLASLFHKVKVLMPKIFWTANWGLFFIDHKNPKIMYTVGSIGKDRDGIEFLRNIIKFPIELGFTGKSMKLQKPLVYYKPEGGDYNETESSIPNKEFLSEVDNYVSQSNLKSGLFGPLIDGDGKIQGAIQLLNKLDGHGKFDEDEINEFEFTCKIIGTTIRNSYESMDIMSLSVKMYSCIQSISAIFNRDLSVLRTSMESGVEKNIKSISTLMKDIISEKKIEIFKNKILMNDVFSEILRSQKRMKPK